jgi:hypothetical protein
VLQDLQGLGSLTTIWYHLSDTWDRYILTDMHPTGVHLTGVHLTGVHLTGVHLTGVHLTGVHLTGVHLTGVHLTGAHLIGAHLTQARISQAYVFRSRPYLSRRARIMSPTDKPSNYVPRYNVSGHLLSMGHLSSWVTFVTGFPDAKDGSTHLI